MCLNSRIPDSRGNETRECCGCFSTAGCGWAVAMIDYLIFIFKVPFHSVTVFLLVLQSLVPSLPSSKELILHVDFKEATTLGAWRKAWMFLLLYVPLLWHTIFPYSYPIQLVLEFLYHPFFAGRYIVNIALSLSRIKLHECTGAY